MLKIDHSIKSDSYRTVVDYPNLPICRILKDGKANILIQAIIDSLRPTAPELFEICSRTGKIWAYNFTFENSPVAEIWPAGNYKVAFKFYDSLDDNIMNVLYSAIIF